MDKLLPRGSPRNLMTFSTFLVRYSSSSSACFTPSPSHSFSRKGYRHNLLSFYSSRNMSKSAMEKPQVIEEAIKDQEREIYCKGACEYNPPKRVSDEILPHILNLYASRATPQDFEIYAPDATFEDPLMCAHGVKQIKSAFYSLAKAFSESRIVDYSIQENYISPGKKEILIDNKQYYKLLGRNINVISLIRLYVENGKVVRHEDWWNKKPILNRETIDLPLVGRVMEMSRRASMLATHALMRFGKDPAM